jgi:hypothetical protein
MASMMKIFLIAMVMVFVDLIIQQITGGDYGIIAIAFFLIRVISAFLVVIVHGLTHWDAIDDDILLLITGIMSLLIWLGDSLIEVLFDLWEIIPRIIGEGLASLSPPLGMGIKIDIKELTGVPIGGILIDFRTITFQITIGDVDGLDIMGIKFYVKNVIGFSLFGNQDYPQMRLITGGLVDWYKTGVGRFGIVLDFKDGAETCLPDLVEIGLCISENLPPFRNPLNCIDPSSDKFRCVDVSLIIETPEDLKVINLIAFIQDILAALPFPSLSEWTDQVFNDLLPAISLINIQLIIWSKLEELWLKCQNVKQLRNMVLI